MGVGLTIVFESNVNYDLGKTSMKGTSIACLFESNVNYDLGKTSEYMR